MIKQFWKSFKKFRVIWIFALFFLVMAVISKVDYEKRQKIVYNQALDEVIATVEGAEITLRDFAVYVAYQEAEVEAKAKIYDSERPEKYWNIHTNGTFLKLSARDEALSMAIHDELFYQLSKEWEIVLTEEDIKAVENSTMDFWADLTDYDKDVRLGITEEDVYKTMEKIAIAEKSQLIYAEMNGVKYEKYNVSEEYFLTFLEAYEYDVNEDVLERLDFGNITLEH